MSWRNHLTLGCKEEGISLSDTLSVSRCHVLSRYRALSCHTSVDSVPAIHEKDVQLHTPNNWHQCPSPLFTALGQVLQAKV